MVILFVVLCVTLWCTAGISALVWDWTLERDLKFGDAVMSVVAGPLLGPVWWVIFLARWCVNRLPSPDWSRVVIERRK